jgi:hypothetical protein
MTVYLRRENYCGIISLGLVLKFLKNETLRKEHLFKQSTEKEVYRAIIKINN